MPSLIIAGLIVRRTIGHPKGFIMLVLLPALVLSIIITLFGSSQDSPKTVAVWNADQGPFGQMLIEQLANEPSIVLSSEGERSEEALRKAVVEGQVDAALYVPENYTASLLKGSQVQPKLYRQSVTLWNAAIEQRLAVEAEQSSAFAAMAAASGKTVEDQLQQAERLVKEQAKHRISLTEPLQSLESKKTKPSNVLVTGVILLFIMLAINQSVQIVMEDRTNRTMARMYTAPVRKYEIALGNFLGSMVLGTVQLLLVLGVTRGLLHYDYGVEFGAHFLVLECFLLAAVGLSTAIAGLVRNTDHLPQLSTLVVTPTCMLGGCFWPIGMMPDFMQKLANFVPQRWAMEAIDRMAFGSGLQDVMLPIGILLLFAAVLLAFGVFILQPNRSAS
ncbi:ABC transporter permease [Paenibacillus mendelii]|uniref:ABC transporter permease n=1 Tax=Paenibacillus mendelii TaxID=206163 RepID=A0ABV6JKG6_9BACL|nr:ABC transporter permease [Paenibacillus mendelii]MCQ6558191.1 ABC transporter permease [Paenibacillus mendelii]